nr:tetratricopeptide repeat protein [Geitlerinema sp. PCC 9228]
MENYRQAIKLDPEDAWTFNSLGNLLQQQGKLEEAIEKYERALEVDPNNTKAQDNLDEAKRMLEQQGNSTGPTIELEI